MKNQNLFWRGLVYGALAGGAISLLDKRTRHAMKDTIQKACGQVSYAVKHSGEISEQIKGTAQKIRTTVEQVSEDISFISGKVDDLYELTPQVKEIVKETKDTFTKSGETAHLDDLLKEDSEVKHK